MKEKAKTPNEMEYIFYLCFIKYQDKEISKFSNQLQNLSSSDRTENNINIIDNSENSKVFVQKIDVINIDTFTATHGPGTDVDCK